MKNGEDENKIGRLSIIIHVILIIGTLISGILIGMYYIHPPIYIKIADEKLKENVNVWNMKLDGDNIITGGKFNTSLTIYNNSIFPITFVPQQIKFFHYPIGTQLSCLHLYPKDRHFNDQYDSANTCQLYKKIDNSSTNNFLSIDDLNLKIETSKGNFMSPRYYDIKWNVGFVIPKGDNKRLYQLYTDCIKYNKLLFSIKIEDNHSYFWFLKNHLPSSFEIIIPMDCKFDEKIHRVFKKTNFENPNECLFDGLEHQKDLFS